MREPYDAAGPEGTVAFGDVPASGTPGPASVSQAEPGVRDSTLAGSGDEGAAADDEARGITSEEAPRASHDVDATPLSQRR